MWGWIWWQCEGLEVRGLLTRGIRKGVLGEVLCEEEGKGLGGERWMRGKGWAWFESEREGVR